MGSDSKADSARVKPRIRLAKVVIGEAFPVRELCVSFPGLNRGNFINELTRVSACNVVK